MQHARSGGAAQREQAVAADDDDSGREGQGVDQSFGALSQGNRGGLRRGGVVQRQIDQHVPPVAMRSRGTMKCVKCGAVEYFAHSAVAQALNLRSQHGVMARRHGQRGAFGTGRRGPRRGGCARAGEREGEAGAAAPQPALRRPLRGEGDDACKVGVILHLGHPHLRIGFVLGGRTDAQRREGRDDGLRADTPARTIRLAHPLPTGLRDAPLRRIGWREYDALEAALAQQFGHLGQTVAAQQAVDLLERELGIGEPAPGRRQSCGQGGRGQNIRVHVLGGQLRPGSHTLFGDEVLAAAQRIRADVLLLGAHAVTDGWLSETLPEVGAVKRALIQAAAHKRLLIDASKFRPAAFTRVCAVADLDSVLTDDAVAPADVAALRRLGVKVKTVAAG